MIWIIATKAATVRYDWITLIMSLSQVIKDYQLFMVVGVLLVIDFGIMTTWQVADPFYRETKQMEPYVSQ